MIASIHQPNFMPWLGFFDKLNKSDVFIILDNSQYQKNSFINRSKIRDKNSEQWLTLPVEGSISKNIDEINISNIQDWRKKHLRTIELNYKKSKNFDDIFKELNNIYYEKEWEKMIDFNIRIIQFIMKRLGIEKKIIYASSLDVSGKSNELLINILRQIGADNYISGSGALDYIDEKLFNEAGIKISFQSFSSPIYKQCWDNEFIPNLSALDYIFNN